MGLYSYTHTHLNKNELAENGLSMNWEPSAESSGNSKGRCHGPQVMVSRAGGWQTGQQARNWETECGRSFAGGNERRRGSGRLAVRA